MASSCCSVGCSCAWFRWTPLLRKPSSYTSEVVARDATSVQILAMSAFLLAFSLLQLTKQPWRSKIANLMDGGLVQMMVLLLLCVAMSTNLDGSDSVIGHQHHTTDHPAPSRSVDCKNFPTTVGNATRGRPQLWG
mmetsp:Transcript_70739/g.229836  ORF Transcript_70739/g.229836 Transcript_70739/m.229836 type:complete len:135 (+) Transcript_70739:876-1280(+)